MTYRLSLVHLLNITLGLMFSILLVFAPAGAMAQDGGPSFGEEASLIASALGLRSGMTVADVGAGDGEYTVFLADRLGAGGRVYATEIVQELVDSIRKNVSGKNNVTVLMGKANSTELPEQCCDRILLRRVYHHMHHPEAMLKSLLAALKPGGEILIIDFLPRHNVGRDDATPEDGEHGVTVPKLIEIVTKSGFELVEEMDQWPSRVVDGRETDFAVLFRRPR